MANNQVKAGPVAEYVRVNVKRLRDEQRLSQAQLSTRLSEVGRPMLPTGIHRLEAGNRRADVDDVVALALALGVTPISLLLPPESEGEVALTDTVAGPARRAWDWIRGIRPLCDPDEDDGGFEIMAFRRRAFPRALVKYRMSDPAGRAAWNEDHHEEGDD